MPDRIFISYSRNDDKWLKRLRIFLKSIDHHEAVFVDTDIEIGEEWLKKIQDALNSARVAILLVSADFVASDFIAKKELPVFLEAAKRGGTMIVPVIISHCVLPESLLGIQAVNPLDKPMTKLDRTGRDLVWVKVVETVKKAMASAAPVVANREAARQSIRSEVQRRIESFVDRTHEIARFHHMLKTRERPVFYVWGGSGTGKTALFYRMIHECESHNYRRSVLMWTDIRRYEYLDIMCKIKDDLGGDAFTSFADELKSVSRVTPVLMSGMTHGGGGGNESGSNGGNGSSNPAIISIPESPSASISDLASIDRARMLKLTDLFLGGLARTLKNSSLIVLCDAVEKMSPSAYDWFQQELLEAVSDGRLRNICFALCGREKPAFASRIIEEAQLQPLGGDDIAEYLEKRSKAENLGETLNQTMCLVLAKRILRDTNGKPDDVANWVETLINDYKNQPPN